MFTITDDTDGATTTITAFVTQVGLDDIAATKTALGAAIVKVAKNVKNALTIEFDKTANVPENGYSAIVQFPADVAEGVVPSTVDEFFDAMPEGLTFSENAGEDEDEAEESSDEDPEPAAGDKNPEVDGVVSPSDVDKILKDLVEEKVAEVLDEDPEPPMAMACASAENVADRIVSTPAALGFLGEWGATLSPNWAHHKGKALAMTLRSLDNYLAHRGAGTRSVSDFIDSQLKN